MTALNHAFNRDNASHSYCQCCEKIDFEFTKKSMLEGGKVFVNDRDNVSDFHPGEVKGNIWTGKYNVPDKNAITTKIAPTVFNGGASVTAKVWCIRKSGFKILFCDHSFTVAPKGSKMGDADEDGVGGVFRTM